MNIPDAAIEAAAARLCPDPHKTCGPCRKFARAALTAAMPAIREAIAAEVVSNGPKHPYKTGQTVRIFAWSSGLHAAARIVRGGTP